MKKLNILERFIRFLLNKLNIIGSKEISKENMCRNAQSVCDKNCDCCAWNTHMKGE